MATLMVLSTVSLYHEVNLHISKLTLGSIQAYAVLSAYITKFAAGIIVDIFKNHRFMIFLGSITSMIAKTAFAFISSTSGIFMLRSAERLTKGLRASPTDAFINTLQPKELCGKAFALKQTSYTMGAVIGAFASSAILYYSNNNFTLSYKLAIIPSLLGTLAIYFGIYVKSARVDLEISQRKQFDIKDLSHIPSVFWVILVLTFFMSAARWGETFMSHRLYEAGYPIFQIPMSYVLFDLPFGLISFYSIRIYDVIDWRKIFSFGIVLLAFSNLCLFLDSRMEFLLLGSIFGGLHMGLTQGLFLTVIAKICPPNIQGTAYSIYYVIFGLGTFLGSKMTAHLGHMFNTWRAGFCLGFILCIITFLATFLLANKEKSS